MPSAPARLKASSDSIITASPSSQPWKVTSRPSRAGRAIGAIGDVPGRQGRGWARWLVVAFVLFFAWLGFGGDWIYWQFTRTGDEAAEVLIEQLAGIVEFLLHGWKLQVCKRNRKAQLAHHRHHRFDHARAVEPRAKRLVGIGAADERGQHSRIAQARLHHLGQRRLPGRRQDLGDAVLEPQRLLCQNYPYCHLSRLVLLLLFPLQVLSVCYLLT